MYSEIFKNNRNVDNYVQVNARESNFVDKIVN